MAGIYLHIPFCKQACHYCNFHFATSLQHKDAVVDALCAEITLQQDFLERETIKTVYFGGGTPSLLSTQEIQTIITRLRAHFAIAVDAEITLEANPDDIEKEKLEGWKAAGINRLSMGVQSFFENELVWMNRAHNAPQAKEGLKLALEYFQNITIDLIYGSPLLTDEMWQDNVQTALTFGVPHLSCYALTIEEKTPLQKQIDKKQKQPVDGDKQAHQFLLLMKWLRNAGYEHYEVSNFAKPGFRSRHNSSYWKGEKYLGLGPSAHSYNGKERQWNIANNQQYVAAIKEGRIPAEKETLSSTDRYNEYLMIALRTKEGLDLERIEKVFGAEKLPSLKTKLQVLANQKLVTVKDKRFSLTDEGMLRADGIAANLFESSPLPPKEGT